MRYRQLFDFEEKANIEEMWYMSEPYTTIDVKKLIHHELDAPQSRDFILGAGAHFDKINNKVIKALKQHIDIYVEKTSYGRAEYTQPAYALKAARFGFALLDHDVYIVLAGNKIYFGFTRFKYDVIKANTEWFKLIFDATGLSDAVIDCSYQIPVKKCIHKGFYVIYNFKNHLEIYMFLIGLINEICRYPKTSFVKPKDTRVSKWNTKFRSGNKLVPIYKENNSAIEAFKIYAAWYYITFLKAEEERRAEEERKLEDYNRLESTRIEKLQEYRDKERRAENKWFWERYHTSYKRESQAIREAREIATPLPSGSFMLPEDDEERWNIRNQIADALHMNDYSINEAFDPDTEDYEMRYKYMTMKELMNMR